MFCFPFFFLNSALSYVNSTPLLPPKNAESSHVALKYLVFKCEVLLTETHSAAYAQPGNVTKAELPVSCICHPQRKLSTLFISTQVTIATQSFYFSSGLLCGSQGARSDTACTHNPIEMSVDCTLQGTSHGLVSC